MKRTSLLVIATVTAAILTAQTKTPEAALGAALHQEEVQGDLNGAIASYQKLLASRGLSRKVAAEALYHLGLCYQRSSAAAGMTPGSRSRPRTPQTGGRWPPSSAAMTSPT